MATCTNLRSLSVTTQIDVNWAKDMLSNDSLCNIVAAAWASDMQSFRIKGRLVSGAEQREVGEEVWMATLEDDHLVLVHETAEATRKRLARWSRALDVPFKDFSNSSGRACYEEILRKRMEEKGNAALAAIDSSAIVATRKALPRKAKNQGLT